MENRKMGRRITATLMAAILVASSSVAVFGQDGEVVLDPAESMLMDEQMQAAPESEDIILTAEQLAAIPPSTAEFVIDAKGVLTKYKGSGGGVVIPDGVTGIGDDAFRGCTSLTSVTIPNSVTSIGTYAFRDCTGLTSVIIPNSVTRIDGAAFEGCTGLTNITVDAGNANYSSEGGVVYNKDKTILENFPAGKKGEFIIPNSVTSIEYGAFSGCTSLTSVTIPNSMTSIGNMAFDGCTGLISVTIPNSVTRIGAGAFAACTGLTNITVDAGNANYSSDDGVVYNKDKTILEIFPAGKKGEFIIPNSVTSIGYDAFRDCTGLTSVTIPNSVTIIGGSAFYRCTGLTSVTIPNSVTSIDIWAFTDCIGLTNITVNAGNANYSSEGGVVYNKDKTILEIFPAGKKGGFIIPNSVTIIDYCAFNGCTGLTSVTIPNSVTSIENIAFYGCTGLTSVTIPNSVTRISQSAFNGCTGLTNITVDAGNANYSSEDGVMYNKDKTILEIFPDGKKGGFIIPNSVTSIWRSAFSGCTGLTSVTIPNSVMSIGEAAFYGCTGLTSVTIPNSVTSIGYDAFWGCTALTIYGYKDSYAKTYAKDNKIPFKIIGAQKPADLDGDGEVNLTDLMSVLHGVSKRTEFTQEQITIADVTHDGKVDIEDLMKILHFVSGRIPSLD